MPKEAVIHCELACREGPPGNTRERMSEWMNGGEVADGRLGHCRQGAGVCVPRERGHGQGLRRGLCGCRGKRLSPQLNCGVRLELRTAHRGCR